MFVINALTTGFNSHNERRTPSLFAISAQQKEAGASASLLQVPPEFMRGCPRKNRW
jgi:hypothetical protein